MNSRALGWLAALATAWSAASCAEPAAPAVEARRVVAAPVKAILIPDEVSGFGSLSYIKKVDVTASQEAVISELRYREGDGVEAGAVVARLYNPRLRLAERVAENGVARAEAALMLADARLFEGRLAAESRLLGVDRGALQLELARGDQAEAERKLADQEALLTAGGVPEETVRSGRFSVAQGRARVALMEMEREAELLGLRDEDLASRGKAVPADPGARRLALIALATETLEAEKAAAAAGLDAARKELDSARMAVRDLVVTAPIAGVVGARYLEIGERVERGDKLVSIIDVASLYAVASIQEAEAVRLARGQRAKVIVDAAGLSLDGEVDLISPIADARSASFAVRVAIADPAGRLRPGMFARIKVSAGPPERVLVVPEGAVLDRSGDSGRVLAVIGAAARERRVALGKAVEAGRVIVSGLAEGEVVVDAPDPALKEGDRVSMSN